MGVDRRNYVISAEDAMSREMSYRHKLQLMPQVPTTPTPTLAQNQRPPMPHAQTSLTRLWSPILSADQAAVSTSGPMWRPINIADQKRKAPVSNDQPAQLGSFFCLVCQIDCTTSYNLMMHYQGQRHKAKLQGDPRGIKKKNVTGPTSLSTAKDRLYCKLCGIWCKDEFTFRFHLQCKNHVLTLHEHEKNMKKPRN